MEQTKPFWASRTIWANLVMVAGVVLESTGVTNVLDPETQSLILGGIMGIVNVILRFVTKDAVVIQPAPEE